MGEYRGRAKCLFKFLEGFSAVVGEIPWDIFSGEVRERHCDFRVFVNKTVIEVGKPEERHYVPDFTGLGPVLDGLDFVLGHREAIGRQHIS